MKAKEFLRDNGIVKCSRIVEDLNEQGVDSDFVKHLKRLVESHELVEHAGGLDSAKKQIELKDSEDNCLWCVDLKIAIADVESCQ